MDKFANMQAFQSVAETGNFAESARRMGLANSVVSKRIKDLEAALGTQLFVRTTRSVTLTDTGRTYLSHVRKIFEDLNDIEADIRKDQQKPSGAIKLTAPLSFGMQYLAPPLSSYLLKYPDVTIRTHLSDRYVDMVGEGFDVAIRIGTMKDSNLIARKICSARRVVCASPAYFKKSGKPQKPVDLKDHNCLSYLNLADGKSWPFMVGGRKIWQPVSGNFYSDNGDLLYQAALSGCGIALLPTFIVGSALAEKKLLVALEEFEETNFDIHAVYQQTKHLSGKVRTFIDHLAETLKV